MNIPFRSRLPAGQRRLACRKEENFHHAGIGNSHASYSQSYQRRKPCSVRRWRADWMPCMIQLQAHMPVSRWRAGWIPNPQLVCLCAGGGQVGCLTLSSYACEQWRAGWMPITLSSCACAQVEGRSDASHDSTRRLVLYQHSLPLQEGSIPFNGKLDGFDSGSCPGSLHARPASHPPPTNTKESLRSPSCSHLNKE